MNKKTYTIKRLVVGLLVMTFVSIVLAYLPPLFAFSIDAEQFFLDQPLPTIEQSLKIAIAAFTGAFVARVPIVLATIVYYASLTLYSFYVLMLIAEPVQPVTMVEIIARNAFGTAFGLVAAVVGADLGSRLGKRKSYGLAEAA